MSSPVPNPAPSANLAMLLTAQAKRAPERTALRLDAESLSYGELTESSARMAATLRAQGVGPGDRVGLMAPNVPAFAALYYGILRAGAVVVPMNPLLKAREIDHYLTDSGAALLLAWTSRPRRPGGGRGRGTPCLAVGRDSLPELLAAYAPGSEPALACRRGHRGHPLHLRDHRHAQGCRAHPPEPHPQRRVSARSLLRLGENNVLGGLPLFHSFGQTCGLNCAVATGACLTLLPRFDPACRCRSSSATGHRLPRRAHHVRRPARPSPAGTADMSSTAAVRLRRRRAAGRGPARLREAFGCVVLEGFGLSETSPVASFNHPDGRPPPRHHRHPDRGRPACASWTTGRPLPDGESGEIAIRGHNVMKGYWGRPEATAETVHGRLAAHRRHRRPRRGRPTTDRGPQEGPDHPRRLQRLPPRDRGSPLRTPRRGRGRGDRCPPPHPRRGGRRRGGCQTRRDDHPGRAAGVRPGQVAPYKYPRMSRSPRPCPRARPARFSTRDHPVPGRRRPVRLIHAARAIRSRTAHGSVDRAVRAPRSGCRRTSIRRPPGRSSSSLTIPSHPSECAQ